MLWGQGFGPAAGLSPGAEPYVCRHSVPSVFRGALTMRDTDSNEEERWVTMGLDGLGRVLVVVYTWRGENVPPDFCTKSDGVRTPQV
jgi:hypothetical protein